MTQGSTAEPEARYDFEGTGRQVTDRTGNGHDGELVRATRVGGRGGTVVQFDRANETYVELGSEDTLDPRDGSYSASFWFRSERGVGSNETLFAKRGGNNERFRVTLRTEDGEGHLDFRLKDDPDLGNSGFRTEESYTDGEWHHVLAVRDTAERELRLYVDGSEVRAVRDEQGDVDPTGPLYLGGQPEYPHERYFTGQLDDVSVYHQAVTPSDVGQSSPEERYEFGFEDNSFGPWSPVELPEQVNDRDGNDWSVTPDAIAGRYSLHVETLGDHDDNSIASDERLIDMRRDFDVGFAWRTPDPDNRGPSLRLLEPDGQNFENDDDVYPENGISMHYGGDAISREGSPYNGDGHFCGTSFERASYASDTAHTVRVRKRGDEATLYWDGERQRSARVRTSGQYRLVIGNSGTWGNRSALTIDDIYVAYGDAPPATPEDPETPTPTATPHRSPTATPTPSPTMTPTSTETVPYRIEDGDPTTVRPGARDLYVVTDIPDAADDRVAVTTPRYDLVSPFHALGALYTYVWTGGAWPRDTRQEIEKTEELRRSEYRDELFGRFVDAGWDITMLISLGVTLGPGAALGATVDAMFETLPWIIEEVQQPYKTTFQEMAASLEEARETADEIEALTSYHNVGEQGEEVVSAAIDAYETASAAAEFWDDFLGVLDDTGSLITSGTDALTGASGFFAGFAASLAVEQIESVIKAKTTIHSIGFAYATVRLPVLRELESLERKIDAGEASRGEIYLYHRYLFTDYQMSKVAWEAVGEYWQEISDTTTGSAWDVLVDADGKAETAMETAKTMEETAKYTMNILGAGGATAREYHVNSINLELLAGDSS